MILLMGSLEDLVVHDFSPVILTASVKGCTYLIVRSKKVNSTCAVLEEYKAKESTTPPTTKKKKKIQQKTMLFFPFTYLECKIKTNKRNTA